MRTAWVRAILGAGAALAAGCSGPPEAPPETTLIGLDGADWRNALPLMRQGKLPVLAALKRSGTSGILLTNPDYRWSPVLWTSIATGKLPDQHGVTSFMTSIEGLDRRIPTPSTERKCRALWNLFSEADRTVGFVGWWVTWPAEPVNGFLVSDHFSVSRFDLGRDYESAAEDERLLQKQTYPEELLAEIRPLRYERTQVNADDLARFARLPREFEWPERFEKFDRVSEFAIAHSVDRTHFAAGSRLLAERDPELFGIFLQGVDILQHFFWEYMDPAGTGTGPSFEDRHVWGESIESYYRFADGLVGELVDAGGHDRAVMIVSDHGFRPSTERWEDKHISGEHRRQAFFLATGPGVRRGAHASGVDAVDVTPTVLAYHGLAVAEDMDGEAARSIFTPEWEAEHPPRTIETYETGPWERAELPDPEASLSEDLEERIRAIGYID